MSKTDPGIAHLTGYSLAPTGRHVDELELFQARCASGRYPPQYLTLYYGAKTTLREMSKLRAEALRNELDLYPIIVSVNVQQIVVGFATLGDLRRTRILNMERASKGITERIQEYWSVYLHEEGKNNEWIESNVEWERHRYMSERPDLLARLANEPEFSHLALIVHQMVAGSEVLKVGTILDREAIKRAVCKSHPSLSVIFP